MNDQNRASNGASGATQAGDDQGGTGPAAKVTKTDAQWREQLSPIAYEVARKAGTERAFSGELWDTKEAGRYDCVCCDQPLFSSQTKYDSGTGWPSFYAPVSAAAVENKEDRKLFMLSLIHI